MGGENGSDSKTLDDSNTEITEAVLAEAEAAEIEPMQKHCSWLQWNTDS